MQKWQQRQRRKIHQSIIQNAKPTLHLNENIQKSRQKQFITTSRSKQLHQSRMVKPQVSFQPFVKILELFQLQKYSALLIEYGFPHKLAQKKSMKFIDDILDKVQEQDQSRFLSLMNTLTIMSKDLIKNKNKNGTSNSIIKQQHVKTIHYPPKQHPSNTNFRKSFHNLTSTKKTQKPVTSFKVRQSNNFKNSVNQMTQINLNPRFTLSQKSKSNEKKDYKCQISKSSHSGNLRNFKTPKSRKRQAYDDTFIVHRFRNANQVFPERIGESNKVIEKLMQKLRKINPQKYLMGRQSALEINLDMDRIKKMYLSFDSATLTSNIHNIDLEEIIDCLVEEVYSLIQEGEDSKVKTVKGFKRSETRRKVQKVERKCLDFENKEEIEYLLRESLVVDQPSQTFPRRTFINPQSSTKEDYHHLHLSTPPKEELEANSSNDLKNEQTKSISLSSSSSSSSSGFEVGYEGESFVEDWGCFDNKLEQSMRKVQKSDIKNFIQLVMMAGKMEKEMPIIAYMYLKRLFNSKKLYHMKQRMLSIYNWRNIILVALISASKIWDDTSLQNHSFSKAIKAYTTYEINRLQKYFLYFIDYELTINQKQYCESYFQLRRHSVNANKTVHLMSLDVKTIKDLENKKKGIKSKQVQLKEFYKNKMDKSF